MNGISATTVLFILSTCSFVNADKKEVDKAIFLSNFGCGHPGEYPPHRPNAPNCPCGTFSVEIKTKHLGKYQERTGYWDVDKRRWQLYRCKKCDVCYNVPVRKMCSADSNTECGLCYPPLIQTSIGCMEPPTNASTNGTYLMEQPSTEHLDIIQSTAKQPVYMCNNPCNSDNGDINERIAIAALVLFLLSVVMIFLLITVLIVLRRCIYQSSHRNLTVRRYPSDL